MPYSKLNNLAELNANDEKFHQLIERSYTFQNIRTYGTVNSIFLEIHSGSMTIKNDPRIYYCS